jgi:probable HAF family extracellular repeat protein
MTDLGLPPFGTDAWANAVNDARTIVGEAWDYNGFLHYVGWIWKAGTYTLLYGAAPIASQNSHAYDVNSHDEVVGEMTAADGSQHAFRYTTATVMVDLHPGAAYEYSTARSISESGVVVGTASKSGLPRIVEWSAQGVFRDLGALGVESPVPTSVNASGTVVGYFLDSPPGTGARQHPFSWRADSPLRSLDAVGVAFGVSDAGRVVGISGDTWNRPPFFQAFVLAWTKQGTSLTRLPLTEGATMSVATDVNRCGSVAGHAATFTPQRSLAWHALRWTIAACD